MYCVYCAGRLHGLGRFAGPFPVGHELDDAILLYHRLYGEAPVVRLEEPNFTARELHWRMLERIARGK